MQHSKGIFTTMLFMLSLVLFFSSCKKDKQGATNDNVITDKQKIKLKEVAIQGLPSPYFHFVYDTANFVTELKHESDIFQYKIAYKNGRVSRMINTATLAPDTLLYHYTKGNVTRIDLVKPNQGKTEETTLAYDQTNRLIEATWKNIMTATVFKKMLFQYNAENNLSRCEIYYFMNSGLEKTNTYIFEQFDNKENLTSNYLLKEAHYLYLPQVQLQKNNPLRAKLYGIENDFDFVYSYQYNDSLPILRTSSMTQTRGSGSGTILTGVTQFTYY